MLITDWKPAGEHIQIREVGKFTEMAWTQRERSTLIFEALSKNSGAVIIEDIHCELVGWRRFIPDWMSRWFDRTLACKAMVRRDESK